ncbi:MAG: AraC family transcriptional regulator [Nannocystaceae bacterium]
MAVIDEGLALFAGPGFVLQHARADATSAPLSPHFHAEYLLCAQLQGDETCEVAGHAHRLHAGDVFLLNPEQVHTGHDGASEGLEYVSLYVDREWAERLAVDLGGVARAPEFLRVRVERALPLVRGLQHLWTRVAAADGEVEAADRLTLEGEVVDLVADALASFSNVREPHRRPAQRIRHRRVRRVLEYLHTPGGATDLQTLADLAGLSKYHFLRHFAAEVGLTPGAYLRTLRISESARSLRRGVSVEAAAQAAGFTNLTAYTRSFRRIVGTTPLRYARACADALRATA